MALSTFVNPRTDMAQALRAADKYLTPDAAGHAWSTITAWPEYHRTPTISRPDLAAITSVGAVLVKDEAVRSKLRSFKSLGGAYAVQLAHQRWQREGGARPFVPSCVTDGNHGLSVAWGAKALGLECVIYVPAVVSQARADAIAEQGAIVVRVDGNYDEVTEAHGKDATRQGWTVITDSSPRPESPTQSPIDVMNGYSVLAREMAEDLHGQGVTHVLIQGGCGGLAGAILPALLRSTPDTRFIIVEPERAACLQLSARRGELSVVDGDLHTRMVGMSVGEVSRLAWPIIAPSVEGYVSVGDQRVEQAMRLLGQPASGARAIESGETGCAGLVALLELADDAGARSALSIDDASRIVLINTEGATDKASYRIVMDQ